MGGLHGYYAKDHEKKALVWNCNVVSYYYKNEKTNEEIHIDYVFLDEDDVIQQNDKVIIMNNITPEKYMHQLCDEFESEGYKEVEWMYNNNNFWTEHLDKCEFIYVTDER
ncbi:hypothetical protein EBV26_21025, partial [bacterium]|nr:hypothetical protein [bacterium]